MSVNYTIGLTWQNLRDGAYEFFDYSGRSDSYLVDNFAQIDRIAEEDTIISQTMFFDTSDVFLGMQLFDPTNPGKITN